MIVKNSFRKRFFIAVGLASLLCLAFVSFSLWRLIWAEIDYLSPKPSASTLNNAAFVDVTFSTLDGLSLSGWFSPSRNNAYIIFVHGSGGNRAELLNEALVLQKEGFGVLLYDSRGHGASQGKIAGYGENETLDINAAISWLISEKGAKAERIGAFGFSVGGLALVKYASYDLRISSLVLAAVPTSVVDLAQDRGGRLGPLTAPIKRWAINFGGGGADIDARLAVKKISPRPLLLLYAERDLTVPLKRGYELFDAAGQPKQVAVIKGADHQEMFERDPITVSNLLVEYFKSTLLIDTKKMGR